MSTLNSAKFRARCMALVLSVTLWVFIELLSPVAVWAHKVNVFAYVEGDTVFTESYFNDGRKCRDSTIEIFNGAGEKLLEGKTDEEGVFSFAVPARTNLLIRLTASMGHQAEYMVPATDLPVNLPESQSPAPGEIPRTTEDQAARTVPVVEPAVTQIYEPHGMAEIEEAFDRALARQLAPIRRALEESQSKQRVSDIVGGIGYIIGLMGLVTYFRYRQRQKQG